MMPSRLPDEVDQRAPETIQLDTMSRVVRNIYILLRTEFQRRPYDPGPRWDGGRDRYGKMRRSVWPKFAAFIIERGFEPMLYIQFHFDNATTDRVPLPDYLCSVTAAELYVDKQSRLIGDLAKKLAWEIGGIQAEMRPLINGLRWEHDRALRFALRNTSSVHARSLTRYCLAVEYGMDDIAEYYHDHALFQYAFQKNAYDAAWPCGAIPDSLKQEAEALIERVMT